MVRKGLQDQQKAHFDTSGSCPISSSRDSEFRWIAQQGRIVNITIRIAANSKQCPNFSAPLAHRRSIALPVRTFVWNAVSAQRFHLPLCRTIPSLCLFLLPNVCGIRSGHMRTEFKMSKFNSQSVVSTKSLTCENSVSQAVHKPSQTEIPVTLII